MDDDQIAAINELVTAHDNLGRLLAPVTIPLSNAEQVAPLDMDRFREAWAQLVAATEHHDKHVRCEPH